LAAKPIAVARLFVAHALDGAELSRQGHGGAPLELVLVLSRLPALERKGMGAELVDERYRQAHLVEIDAVVRRSERRLEPIGWHEQPVDGDAKAPPVRCPASVPRDHDAAGQRNAAALSERAGLYLARGRRGRRRRLGREQEV